MARPRVVGLMYAYIKSTCPTLFEKFIVQNNFLNCRHTTVNTMVVEYAISSACNRNHYS